MCRPGGERPQGVGDLAAVRRPAGPVAAVGRGGAGPSGTGRAGRYAAEDRAALRPAGQPTLYLHGSADGCIGVELSPPRSSTSPLAPGW